MKKILLLIISFILLSCNTARKTKTNIQDLENNSKTNLQSDSGIKSETKSQTQVNLNSLIDEFGLSVKSNGQQYSLNYGGLQFVGSADIELKKKTESHQLIYIYQHWNVYHHWNITKKQEITRTNYKNKIKDIDAKKDNFWLSVLIFFAGMSFMLFLVYLWNRYNPNKIFKTFKSI
ncbi:hypothetical protein [Epilithonimonas hominis]|uniref:hypothetical protein n=1 Tax=Epilithonimonas hominis TaxID=420404 RepID=UPI002896AFC5|nr:hypothetical protein [Epilithonimonas hominis]